MKVAVFGLGYVGSVSAANFAADGHDVIGVDVNPEKVAAINGGHSPIVEPGLEELLQQGRRRRAGCARPRARRRRFADTDLSLICVGTPSRKNGSLDLSYLVRVCEQIGDCAQGQADVSRRRRSQHGASGHDARATSFRRSKQHSGKKYGEGIRCVRQSRVPSRRDGAEGLPPAAAHARRPQPCAPTRRRPRRCTTTSRRRSTAPASASPR